MVEINEESTDSGATHSSSSNTSTQSGSAMSRMMEYIKSRQMDALLCVLRIATVVFSLLYIFPISVNQRSAFQRALIAGAATNALRLHQRVGGFRFSREFLATLFMEDSCHYLFFCLVFVGTWPITMALFPIFLFALLHSASYVIQVLNVGGMQNSALGRALRSLVDKYSQTLLQLIASIEIFLMPMLIFMCFGGKANIVMPFVYYRFLTLRYMSRRNPHTSVSSVHTTMVEILHLCSTILKILIVACCCAVLSMLTSNFSDYRISYMLAITACTLLYCILSILVYFTVVQNRSDRLDDYGLSELLLSLAGIIAYFIHVGLAGEFGYKLIDAQGMSKYIWMAVLDALTIAFLTGNASIACIVLRRTRPEQPLPPKKPTRHNQITV